jgi:hypothetical protein
MSHRKSNQDPPYLYAGVHTRSVCDCQGVRAAQRLFRKPGARPMFIGKAF